MIAITITIK